MEEMMEGLESLEATATRLALTASNLEAMAASLERQMYPRQGEINGHVAQMVTVDGADLSAAGASGAWEARLAEVERCLAELRATVDLQSAASYAASLETAPVLPGLARSSQGRRTLPASTTNLLAKHGMTDAGPVEQGALDAALQSLPVEQRIAVKSQLLRAGLLS